MEEENKTLSSLLFGEQVSARALYLADDYQ